MRKSFKAEIWDKQQNIMLHYYDGMIRAALYYDGKINCTAMYKAVEYALSKVDVLHSSFHNGVVKGKWKLEEYKKEDFFFIKEVCEEKLEEENMAFLTQAIPAKNNVQLLCCVADTPTKSTVNFLVSHMCLDGGDMKQLIKLIISSYNEYVKTEKITTKYKNGDRSIEQLYEKYNEEDKKHAKKLYKNVSVVKYKYALQVKPSPQDIPTINKFKIKADDFKRIKIKSKENEVTINDIMTTAYLRTIYEFSKIGNNDPYSMNCMMDLRKYTKNYESSGFTNLVGFIECNLPKGIGNSFEETLESVKASFNQSKNDRFAGLYSHPLLKFAFSIFPHQLARMAIKIGFFFPYYGMSNIGLLKEEDYKIDGLNMEDIFLTGAIKKKPYVQLAFSCFNDELTFVIAMNCNEQDKKLISEFYSYFESQLLDYVK